jgi:hypothetical protein
MADFGFELLLKNVAGHILNKELVKKTPAYSIKRNIMEIE